MSVRLSEFLWILFRLFEVLVRRVEDDAKQRVEESRDVNKLATAQSRFHVCFLG